MCMCWRDLFVFAGFERRRKANGNKGGGGQLKGKEGEWRVESGVSRRGEEKKGKRDKRKRKYKKRKKEKRKEKVRDRRGWK